MKHVFLILLLCLIFQSVLTARGSPKMRMAKAAQALKRISKTKEKNLRKLQNTDVVSDTEAGGSSSGNQTETSGVIPDTSVQTSLPVENYIDNSPADAPESANATASNANVSVDKPVAVKPKTTGNSNAAVQVTKFHGFRAPRGPGRVNFGVFFYFVGRPIVKFIVMRLRITYKIGLRNLQETTAESARTDCTLSDPSLAGKTLSEEEGKNINYNCEANATQGDASTANFTLNTDVPMTMVNANGTSEALDFSEVNFNGDATDESTSLQSNTQTISESYIFTATSWRFTKKVLVLTGTLSSGRRLRNLALTEGQTVQMTLIDNSNNGNKYDCTINGVSSSSSTLECDTSNNPLKTTVGKLNLNSGTANNNSTLFTLKMSDNLDGNTPIVTASSYVKPTAEVYDNSTNDNQAERGNATSQDATVNAGKPVSSKGQVVDIKDNPVQILKFHSFKDRRSDQGIISFGSFFYFIGRAIPYSVIFRLRVNYNSRLRNLQAGTADSLRSDCIIVNESLYGKSTTNGKSVNYYCTANPTRSDRISKVQLNTDFNLALADINGDVSTLDFNSVSFNGIASDEATNIQSNTAELSGMTTISEAIAAIQNYYLAISGTLDESSRRLRRLALRDGETVTMDLKTISNGYYITNKYDCIFSRISTNTGGLLCDTSGNPINTNVENLHLSTGNSSDTLITVKMKNWSGNNTALVASSQNKSTYNKSSSGLSGGAIAGIVIACVVLLAGASIAAIMLRKPSSSSSPPYESTTAVDLKNESTQNI